MCLKDIVDGLDGIMFNDLMENIEWFFNLHDKDKDGSLTKDELLKVSESLLVSLQVLGSGNGSLTPRSLVHFPL